MRLKSLIFIGISGIALIGCDRVLDKFRPDDSAALAVPPPPPARIARPIFVDLDTDAVLVGMDDSIQCRGSAGASFGSAGWSGVLSECPYPYTYAVQLAAGSLSGRLILQEVAAPEVPPPDDAPQFRPIAVVVITDTLGESFRFESAEGF